MQQELTVAPKSILQKKLENDPDKSGFAEVNNLIMKKDYRVRDGDVNVLFFLEWGE